MQDFITYNEVNMDESGKSMMTQNELKRMLNDTSSSMPQSKPSMSGLNRAQRRKREQIAKRKLRHNVPIIKPDYRWRKLKQEQQEQVIKQFESSCKSCYESLRPGFITKLPYNPKWEECTAVLAKYNAKAVYKDVYTWQISIPVATGKTAFDLRINEVMLSDAEVCIMSQPTEPALKDWLTECKCIDKFIELDDAKNSFCCLLAKVGKVHTNWHDGITVDEVMLHDILQMHEKLYTLSNPDTNIEAIIDKYKDIVKHVDVTTTIKGTKRTVSLVIDYFDGVEKPHTNLTYEELQKRISKLRNADLYIDVPAPGEMPK